MSEKRIWGAPRGQQGSISDPVTELVKQNRAEIERRRLERQDSIDELKSEAEKKELEQKLSGEDKQRMADLEQQNEELQRQLHEKEIETVRVELSGKIDQLSQSIKEGASQKSIGQQIADIKQAAADMGLGGTKFDDIQAALDLVERLKPTARTLPEQVKDAKDLVETFGTKTDGGNLSLEIEKVKGDREMALAKLNADIVAGNRDFQLKLKQWEEEREDKKAIASAELTVKREGNQLLADLVEKLAQVILAAKGGAVASAATGAIASREILAGEGDSGEVECPGCHGIIPISEAVTNAICPTCGTGYSISRIAKPASEATKVGA